MKEVILVTVYMPNGKKVIGDYIGSPDDFKRTFQQYKMHPKSKEFGINPIEIKKEVSCVFL